MIHLETLPGYKDHKSMEHVTEKALEEAEILEKGCVDAILVENSEDHPHTEKIPQETLEAFIEVAKKIINKVSIPIGIIVLWNDYKAALQIAKKSGAKFIRVPVFVDKFDTEVGIVTGTPEDVIAVRKKLGAENIKIYTDIHVKHSVMLTKRSIEESAKDALAKGSDGLIITGKVTGDAPVIDDLKRVRKACPNAKILIGSGTTANNIKSLAEYADSTIIGTYLKIKDKVNLEKVKKIMALAK